MIPNHSRMIPKRFPRSDSRSASYRSTGITESLEAGSGHSNPSLEMGEPDYSRRVQETALDDMESALEAVLRTFPGSEVVDHDLGVDERSRHTEIPRIKPQVKPHRRTRLQA